MLALTMTNLDHSFMRSYLCVHVYKTRNYEKMFKQESLTTILTYLCLYELITSYSTPPIAN